MAKSVTVGYYLLKRVCQLGCRTLQGVPGDFNLAFLDIVEQVKGLKWSGNCNELNAAYAADGYSRVSGKIGAIVTTFGVGELSAMNGIAGSFCEYVPTVHIVGVPSQTAQASHKLIHHNLDVDFTVFQQMARPISAAQAIINDPNLAAALIDNTLKQCVISCKPVYIALPTNLAFAEIDATALDTPIDVTKAQNDPEVEGEVIEQIMQMIYNAKQPIILADAGVMRYRPGKVRDLVHELIDKTDLPFFVTPMGKSSLDESNQHFGGTYIGSLSTPPVKAAVEKSDLILHVGAHKTDLNTGSFTVGFSANQVVEFHWDHVKIRYADYPGIAMNPVIQKVIERLEPSKISGRYTSESGLPSPTLRPTKPLSKTIIEHDWFWPRMQSFFQKGDIIVSEAGCALFGLLDVRLPDVNIVNQLMWSSIGYTVGATLGACLAAKDMGHAEKRVILIIGDGSLQMAVQELSTMIWRDCRPIIFVINNDGYTVERFIHGAEQPYNDINPQWEYTSLLDVLGGKGKSKSYKVETPAELDKLLLDPAFAAPTEIKLCEIMMAQMDAPRALRLQANLLGKEPKEGNDSVPRNHLGHSFAKLQIDMANNTQVNNANRGASIQLTAEEKRIYGSLFKSTDKEGLGVITGSVAVGLFKTSGLGPQILAEIWQIADQENQGFLTQPSFCIAMRLIAQAQNGKLPSYESRLAAGPPFPKFEGYTQQAEPTNLSSPTGKVQLPPLRMEDRVRYVNMFENTGPQYGVLSGERAREVFLKARLPEDILAEVWNLADTRQRGSLDVVEFTVAMHLIQSLMSRTIRQLPEEISPKLLEAAAGRMTSTMPSTNKPMSPPIRTSSQASSPSRQTFLANNISGLIREPLRSTDQDEWHILPGDRVNYDRLFSNIDQRNFGYISGDEAVNFFLASKLPEEDLAQIWDLADVRKVGQLNSSEFAIAMHMIRRRLAGRNIPTYMPSIPSKAESVYSMSSENDASSAMKRDFGNLSQSTNTNTNTNDLFSLDPNFAPSLPSRTVSSATEVASRDLYSTLSKAPLSPPKAKGFVPTSSFGQSLGSPNMSGSVPTPSSQTPLQMSDLLGEADPEINKKLTVETAELANLSNQISSLGKATQELKIERNEAEADLLNVSSQKKAIEAKLAQIRALYDAEVKNVKQVKDKLLLSREETNKMRQEVTVLEASLNALREQNQEQLVALQKDQQENAHLKERLRSINEESNRIKLDLEKIKRDARQQRGLVTINKKQVSTAESERDKIKEDMEKEVASTKEITESTLIISPAHSTFSTTNPFYRAISPERTPQSSFHDIEGPQTSHAAKVPEAYEIHSSGGQANQFAESFADSFAHPSAAHFANSNSNISDEVSNSFHSANETLAQPPPNPNEAPPLLTNENLSPLLLRSKYSQSDSISSSVVANPAMSTMSLGESGSAPESPVPASPRAEEATPPQEHVQNESSFSNEMQQSPSYEYVENHGPHVIDSVTSPKTISETLKHAPRDGDLALPEVLGSSQAHVDVLQREHSISEKQTLAEVQSSSSEPASQSNDDPFALRTSQNTSKVATKADFDAAFANLGNIRPGQINQEGQFTNRFNQEFPPIEEFDRSEDESEQEEPDLKRENSASNLDVQSNVNEGHAAGPIEPQESQGILPHPAGVPNEPPSYSSLSEILGPSEILPEKGNREEPMQMREASTYIPSTSNIIQNESNRQQQDETLHASVSHKPVDEFATAFSDLEETNPASGDVFDDSFANNSTFDDFDTSFGTFSKDIAHSDNSQSIPDQFAFDSAFAEFDKPKSTNGNVITDTVKFPGISNDGLPAEPDSADLQSLISMGFSRKFALSALEKHNYNLQEATNFLLDQS